LDQPRYPACSKYPELLVLEITENVRRQLTTDEATRMPDEATRMSTDEGTRVTMKNLTWAEVVRGKRDGREIMMNSIIISIESNKDRVS